MQSNNDKRIVNLEKDLKAVISLLQEEVNERHANFETSNKTKAQASDLEVFQNFLNSVKCTFDRVDVLGKKMVSLHGKFAEGEDYTNTMKKYKIDTLRIGNGLRFGGITFYYAREDIQDLTAWIKASVIKA